MLGLKYQVSELRRAKGALEQRLRNDPHKSFCVVILWR